MGYLDAEPNYARALLQADSRPDGWVLSAAADALKELLRGVLVAARRDAVLTTVPDELRLLAVTAAMETLGRRYLDQGGDAFALESTLVDVIVRAFR